MTLIVCDRSVLFKNRYLDGREIFALNQPAGILARCDVFEWNVPPGDSKQRNPLADQNWDTGNDEPLNEPGPEKPLDRNSAIDVGMADPPCFELRHDLLWGP